MKQALAILSVLLLVACGAPPANLDPEPEQLQPTPLPPRAPTQEKEIRSVRQCTGVVPIRRCTVMVPVPSECTVVASYSVTMTVTTYDTAWGNRQLETTSALALTGTSGSFAMTAENADAVGPIALDGALFWVADEAGWVATQGAWSATGLTCATTQ